MRGGRIDWRAARLQLRQSEQALRQAGRPATARFEEILAERAVQLAGRAPDASGARRQATVLAVGVGDEFLGVETGRLAGVERLDGCTPVPGAKPELAGVVNRRGRIYPLYRLGTLLGLPAEGAAVPAWGLFLRQSEVGLGVDRVEGFREIDPDGLRQDVAWGEGLVKGASGGLSAVVDLEAVLRRTVAEEIGK